MAKIHNIADLKPDNKNANKGTQRGRGMVESSLRETGAGRSIVVDKEGRVIAGNKTLEAWADIADLDDVVVVPTDGKKLVIVQREDLDLSDDTGMARKLAIYDNRAGELGLEWDSDELFASMQDGLDLGAFWSDDELGELFADFAPPPTESADAEPQIDRAEELRQQWGVEIGQLWRIGEHRLICGDCTDADVVARVMDGEKAAICFTSPPYNLGDNVALSTRQKKNNSYNEYDDNNENYLGLLESFTNHTLSICQYALVNVQFLAGNKFDLLRWLHLFTDHFADVAVWTKSNPQPAMARCVMDSAFEMIFFLASEKNPTRAISTGDFRGLVSNVLTGSVNAENIIPDSHSATFPTYLPEYFVCNFAAIGNLVYEPFAGSGTTIVACENLSRKCRAIEISPAYCAVILQRMQDAFPGIEIELLGI